MMDEPYTIKIFPPEPNSDAIDFDFHTHKNVVSDLQIFMTGLRDADIPLTGTGQM